MNFFTAQDNTKIFYKDIGSGAPVILIHGWPLSADMWDEQSMALLEAGYRVISYDRRGFGRSEQPAQGYDYDTFANDLNDLVTELSLVNFSIVGFSMGAGEAARYLSKYGSEKISSVALVAGITPIVNQTSDNPNGVPKEKLKQIDQAIREDRFAFFHSFFKDFYGVGLVNKPTSDQTLAWAEVVAGQASLQAILESAKAFGETDFRTDMKSFASVPTLIVHGTSDKTVPIETSGAQAAEMIPHAIYKPYEGAPHGLNITHKKELNKDLVEFLNKNARTDLPLNKQIRGTTAQPSISQRH